MYGMYRRHNTRHNNSVALLLLLSEFVYIFLGSIVNTNNLVDAHGALTFPTPRSGGFLTNKDATDPCGMPQYRTKGNVMHTFISGSTITATWDLPAPHPSDGFKLVLADTGGEDIVLADNIPSSARSYQVTLPQGLTCASCTFQWEWKTTAEAHYRGCSDIAIRSATVNLPANVKSFVPNTEFAKQDTLSLSGNFYAFPVLDTGTTYIYWRVTSDAGIPLEVYTSSTNPNPVSSDASSTGQTGRSVAVFNTNNGRAMNVGDYYFLGVRPAPNAFTGSTASLLLPRNNNNNNDILSTGGEYNQANNQHLFMNTRVPPSGASSSAPSDPSSTPAKETSATATNNATSVQISVFVSTGVDADPIPGGNLDVKVRRTSNTVTISWPAAKGFAAAPFQYSVYVLRSGDRVPSYEEVKTMSSVALMEANVKPNQADYTPVYLKTITREIRLIRTRGYVINVVVEGGNGRKAAYPAQVIPICSSSDQQNCLEYSLLSAVQYYWWAFVVAIVPPSFAVAIIVIIVTAVIIHKKRKNTKVMNSSSSSLPSDQKKVMSAFVSPQDEQQQQQPQQPIKIEMDMEGHNDSSKHDKKGNNDSDNLQVTCLSRPSSACDSDNEQQQQKKATSSSSSASASSNNNNNKSKGSLASTPSATIATEKKKRAAPTAAAAAAAASSKAAAKK